MELKKEAKMVDRKVLSMDIMKVEMKDGLVAEK